jgi:hypothetical protein
MVSCCALNLCCAIGYVNRGVALVAAAILLRSSLKASSGSVIEESFESDPAVIPVE